MRQVRAHYEAGVGIRPPRRSGKVRAVAREFVPGGGMELWHCDHDHAPGVHDCQVLTPEQRSAAHACAEAWVREQMASGYLWPLPVEREQ